ncbi:MAG: carbamoyltransferase [Planctomycetia bacterium]|nr:carbamoyltransferase [Planctomycetia bacterium]
MTAILGISAFYHDSAAALVVDGEIVAAAQEERFTRKKHDDGFPTQAIEYCLQQAGLEPEQLDYVGFYDKPFRKFERLLETYLAFAPQGFLSFAKAMPIWLKTKLFHRREIQKGLRGAYQKRIVFCEHHEAHAASAFYPSPFEDAAVLTIDGVGEWATASYGFGKSNQLTLTHEQHFPHSLGLLYSAFTTYCGFKVNSGEYKLMGLAPYGVPRFAELIKEKLISIRDDGSLWLDLSYFNYCHGLTMTNDKFHRLLGKQPRQAETPITDQLYMDIAASIQAVTEEVVMKMARAVHDVTKMDKLCLAGGVALNCVANGKLLREGPFKDIWIQPAAGDAGGALGVAQLIWHQLLGNPRKTLPTDAMRGSWLGPKFSQDAITELLDEQDAKYQVFSDDETLCQEVAKLLAQGKVVGWFQGRMEFGPRALGSRSILGDPRNTAMQSTMNLKIKFRESFRPFAPAVLQEHVHEWFETKPQQPSPYMLLVAPVRKEKRLDCEAELAQAAGIDKLKVARSQVPAITHVDFSARLQTVDAERHGRYYQLLKAFHEQTGCPILINTSFNVRGEPIVCTPEDAYRCFLATEMDVLVLERAVLRREEQDQSKLAKGREEYLKRFELD